MSKSLDIYEIADKVADRLVETYAKEFGKVNVTDFDALNVIKQSKKLYSWLEKVTKESYLMLANIVYSDFAEEGEELTEVWLSGILEAYDPVTRYVFDNEWERKRQLFVEGMIASKDKKLESKLSAARLAKQSVQYTITVADEAQLEAYRKNGVKKVRWVSERDSRVCDVCSSRDGNVYPINAIPPKPHYNCRCRFEPVEE